MGALKLGYSRKELAVMPYGEIVFDLAAINDSREAIKNEQEPDAAVTDATQEDIRTMLG